MTITQFAVALLGVALSLHLWFHPHSPPDWRVGLLEKRLDALEMKEPPTCWQIHPEKFTIDIYPAPNLGKHPLPKKETP